MKKPALLGIAYLALVSLVWAFSFGLIKQNLTGLSPSFVAASRMGLASLIFLPFTRFRGVSGRMVASLLFCGAVQFGLMYVLYNWSFTLLKAHEVALFTIFTPLYVTLVNDLAERRINRRYLLCALLAVVGTGIIIYRDLHRSGLLSGLVLVQVSNLCFAYGQIHYRRLRAAHPAWQDREIFAFLYLGAAGVTSLAAAFTANQSLLQLSARQAGTLLYLGIVASGVCFFLWNLGAARTNVGTLAVFNNVKIPLAVVCSIFFFSEQANLPRLLMGGGVIVAALLASETTWWGSLRAVRCGRSGIPEEKDCTPQS